MTETGNFTSEVSEVATVAPVVTQPVEAAPPETGKIRCTLCDREFDSMHAMATHRVTHGKTKKPCPYCKKMYMPGPGMTLHQMRMHGVPAPGNGNGSQTPAPKRGRPPKAQVAAQTAKAISADDVLNAVLKVVYPDGGVPIKDLAAWMSWRDTTNDLLRRIHA